MPAKDVSDPLKSLLPRESDEVASFLGLFGFLLLAWRKDFLKAFNKVHEGAQPTMDDLDLDTNWNALSPLEYYTQRIAFSIAYHRAFLRVRRRWSTTTVTVA